jgi:hypothetical protein
MSGGKIVAVFFVIALVGACIGAMWYVAQYGLDALQDWLAGTDEVPDPNAGGGGGGSMGGASASPAPAGGAVVGVKGDGTCTNADANGVCPAVAEGAGAPPPASAPPPSDCTGGTYSLSPCLKRDGSAVPCGQSGVQTKTLTGATPAVGTGTPCVPSEEVTCQGEACASGPVAQDCQVAATWVDDMTPNPPFHGCVVSQTDFTGVSCGGGYKRQSRALLTSATFGGTCPYALTKWVQCKTHACPINCVGGWQTVSVYRGSGCGQEHCTEQYQISTSAAHGGTQCSGVHGTLRSCSASPTQQCLADRAAAAAAAAAAEAARQAAAQQAREDAWSSGTAGWGPGSWMK